MNQTPHPKFRHVYAIVRFDFRIDTEFPENSISPIKVLQSKNIAEKEAARLNEINGEKACRYSVFVTRLVEESEST